MSKRATEYDSINFPKYYNENREIEPVDVWEDWELPPHLANVIKYIARWENKNGMEDLKKAQWFLDRFIKWKEKEK